MSLRGGFFVYVGGLWRWLPTSDQLQNLSGTSGTFHSDGEAPPPLTKSGTFHSLIRGFFIPLPVAFLVRSIHDDL